MSSASFAALRRSQADELAKLAEEHFKHDLNIADKQALQSAASKFSTHALVGSVIGIGVGALLAVRVRAARRKVFEAFKTSERPTRVIFAGGRQEPIPDLTQGMRSSTLGDIAAFTFFPLGGIFRFGELGVLTGGYSAKRTLTSDPEMKRRLEAAFKNFRADVLRKELDDLENNKEKEFLSL